MKQVIHDVILTTDTNAYSGGDVLAATQEIAEFFEKAGGEARIDSMQILDKDNQTLPMSIFFMDTNVALGTENAAPNMSDADAEHIVAMVPVASADFVALAALNKTAHIGNIGKIVKAAAGSRSIYIGAITSGTPTLASGTIRLKIGVTWL